MQPSCHTARFTVGTHAEEFSGGETWNYDVIKTSHKNK